MVEYLAEELRDSQLQEIVSTEDGLVLSFYRYTRMPRSLYIVFDLDRMTPFLGFFEENPWRKIKRTKPVSLFLAAHGKNKKLADLVLAENLGRVVRFELGENADRCEIEFRLIPKGPNLIVTAGGKSISWYPLKDLGVHDVGLSRAEEDVRGLPFLMAQWSRLRGLSGAASKAGGGKQETSPYDKWKAARFKAVEKKEKAMVSIREQIDQFESDIWREIGEHIKQFGLKQLRPEWLSHLDLKQSASQNMQKCFDRSKAGKLKVQGARSRMLLLVDEIAELKDVSEESFQRYLRELAEKSNKKTDARNIGGRLRKKHIPEYDLTAYMGKSAADNMELLRRSKPHDVWVHLKDYPSAHAILHLNKNQKAPESALLSVGRWLLKEGVQEKYIRNGGKFSVMIVECRHVKPIKGDKLGRVTYHNGREMLIAL